MNRQCERNRRLSHTSRVLACLILFGIPSISRAEIEITLNNSFIEQFKDKVTIDTSFRVVKAHQKPNPPNKDGDLHIAGTAPEVGLPMVAEIMNARLQTKAVNVIHAAEGSEQAVPISGAWRIWVEHGGDSTQVQGGPVPPITTTNPDHVFEIHPITKIRDQSLLESFRPVVGFMTKDAHDAFVSYENKKAEIIPNNEVQTTKIVTSMGGYNYVEFRMKPNGPLQDVDDGVQVLAAVLNLQDELLVTNRRMVVPKNTAAEQALRQLTKGVSLHVLGLPRIDLSLVSWRVHCASEQATTERCKQYMNRTEILKWNLPYEMIIVAVYPDKK